MEEAVNRFPQHVLVIDDSELQRQFTAELCSEMGVEDILQAVDGFDAIAQMKTNPQIEVIVLDLEMPGPARHFGEKLVEAVNKGEVSQAVIDGAIVSSWCHPRAVSAPRPPSWSGVATVPLGVLPLQLFIPAPLSPEETAPALLRASDEELVAPVPAAPGRYAFVHAVVRDSLYETLRISCMLGFVLFHLIHHRS